MHELSNNKYSVAAVFIADSFSVATLMVMSLPTLFITYFMMGYPPEALPFVVLCCWVVRDLLQSLYFSSSKCFSIYLADNCWFRSNVGSNHQVFSQSHYIYDLVSDDARNHHDVRRRCISPMERLSQVRLYYLPYNPYLLLF